jgi:hypothetical protein
VLCRGDRGSGRHKNLLGLRSRWCYVACMRAEDRAAALLELLREIERERDETTDNRKRAVLDAEAIQLRAMHTRLTTELLAGATPERTAPSE